MKRRSLIIPALLTLAGSLSPVAIGGDTHVNEDVGYRIRIPDDYSEGISFSSIAEFMSGLSGYMIDNFRSDDVLRTKSGAVFTPSLTTYYFPKRTPADLAKLGKSRGDIYLSFKEYAEAKIKGFYFSSEETFKVAGLPATVYDMTFEKLTGVPRRYQVCAFEVPTGEFAILCSSTEEHFNKLKSDFHATFKSFKMLSPDGLKEVAGKGPTKATPKNEVDAPPLPDDPETLQNHCIETFQATIAGLENGWKSIETDHFLVLFDGDSKRAKNLSRHAEALREWLDERWGSLGQRYVQGMILRIDDSGPSRVEPQKDQPGVVWTYHVVPVDDGDPSFEYRDFNRAYLQLWLRQCAPTVLTYLPYWIRTGISEAVDNAYLKGSRLVFDMNEAEERTLGWLSGRETEFRKEKEGDPPVVSAQVIMGPEGVELFAGKGSWDARAQAAGLVRFLFDEAGSKQKLTQDLLDTYLAHVRNVSLDYAEAEAKRKKEQEELEAKKEEMTDEERLKMEDELYRMGRENSGKNVARDLAAEVFTRAFADWTEKDWATLDKNFRTFIRRYED